MSFNYTFRRSFLLLSIGFSLIFLTACSSAPKNGHMHESGNDPVFYGVAIMHPTEGNKTQGAVVFSESFGRVRVQADIQGLNPNGVHGFHIHEWGDCRAKDATSAGGHYNPEGHNHAGPEAKERHAGDLGNLTADANGRAKQNFTVSNLSIAGRLNPIMGRSVIIHEEPDDLISQPTGGAGARIACGVIGAATR